MTIEYKDSKRISALSSDTKPTNVETNSILVEKDTAKRYWRSTLSASTTKTYDHSGDSVVSVRSVSNSTNWWEAPRQGILSVDNPTIRLESLYSMVILYISPNGIY